MTLLNRRLAMRKTYMRSTPRRLLTKKAGEVTYDGINPLRLLPQIIEEALAHEKVVRTNKRIEYFNVPCAFDIETTSFYDGKEKRAIMYEWTLGINGAVVVGRTWEQFLWAVNEIAERCQLNAKRHVIIYVHNLAFEFQFLRKWLEWDRVFAIDERKPVYAIAACGVEFRCSYILSNYGLATLGKNLQKYKVEKLTGDLDYSLLRHSKTPLTAKELGYCENDVRVVMSYIQERIEADGDISRIPLTNTGYVRTYCRKKCLHGDDKKNWGITYLNYRSLMQSLQLEPSEYLQLKRAFQGGFTHANAFYSGKTLQNVASYDFTSSYPTVMIAERFPMGPAQVYKPKDRDDFLKQLTLYACLFDVEFEGLESISLCEHPLSRSRCYESEGVQEDNGRVVEAVRVRTTLTEQDYYILRRFYKWDKMRLGTFRRYVKGYLPTAFVKAILDLYQKKTTLKGVKGMEEEYLQSKGMLNSCYGMSVTDICRDQSEYGDSGEWHSEKPDLAKAITKNNASKNRFLFFPWGVWITAYARRNLFTGIYEFGNDYIYADTDSIKCLNYEKHASYIDRYNADIMRKLEAAMAYHKLPLELIKPKTIKGVEKPLGVWDFEGVYNKFKTLGAKRYMVEEDGEINITVSGVNKRAAVPYIVQNFQDPFEAFTDDLYIPAAYTGKMTHTYIDEEQTGFMTDYTGRTEHYYERSSVHLEGADYSLSLSDAYIDYLLGIRERNK